MDSFMSFLLFLGLATLIVGVQILVYYFVKNLNGEPEVSAVVIVFTELMFIILMVERILT